MADTRIKGDLLVITGPSGVGKGTLVERIIERVDHLKQSVSVTTRPMRPGEKEGQSYFFRTRAEFEAMVKNGEFMEWAEFAGHLYGTPRAWVYEQLNEGEDVILEIEVQGAKQVHSLYPPAVLIFISPPSFEELEERLRLRGTESEEKIQQRLAKAREELLERNIFQYEVVNDVLDSAVAKLVHIVYAERYRLNTA
ncbi:MAG: guanylate kinase [Cyanobacteria bacterium SZAS LIN-2]|nr:guanylate kinase [Cyanobacteria bacterium SZAS LIN-2]